MKNENTNAPNWKRAEVTKAEGMLQRLDDFYLGTDAVRANRKTYLPQLEAETPLSYDLRSHGVATPGHLTRTVDASVGRVFSIAPEVEANGVREIEQDWQDIDGLQRRGDVFMSRASVYAVLDGFSLVLVDAPVAPAKEVPSNEAAAFRPRWVGFRRKQLYNWRHVIEDGRLVLTMIALGSMVDVEDGSFGLRTEERVRVFRRTGYGTGAVVTAEVWAEVEGTDKKKHWQMIEGPHVYRGPTEIPIAVIAAGKINAPFCVTPPLLALCDKVVEYWQVASDMRHNERMACFPQPVVEGQLMNDTGDGSGGLVLGPTSTINVGIGGGFSWAEIQGDSLEQLREGQRIRSQEMGMLGLSYLVSETRSAETAKAKTLDSAAENATLADAATGIEDGFNQAMIYHAAFYLRAKEAAPVVKINKNLSGEVMDAATATLLLKARGEGELTREELRTLWVRGRIITPEMGEEQAVREATMQLDMEKDDIRDAANATQDTNTNAGAVDE